MKDLLAYYLLDRSGSMTGMWSDTIGGLQSFVQTQAEAEGNAWITVAAFDTEAHGRWRYEVPFEAWNAKDIDFEKQLASIKPWGSTPLLDSIVRAIRELEQQLADRPWFDGLVQLVIQTDGWENSSTDATRDEVRKLIEQKEQEGWEIIFQGAGIDAFETSAALGISRANTMQYDSGTVAANYNTYSTRTLASRAQ